MANYDILSWVDIKFISVWLFPIYLYRVYLLALLNLLRRATNRINSSNIYDDIFNVPGFYK